MPLIGVAASDADWARTYVEATEWGGAETILLLPDSPERVPATLDSIDGLLVTGGADIHPPRYNREPDPNAGLDTPAHEQDEWEIALMQTAMERDMPVLGICRGMQLLNVVCGGQLIQHLPGHRREDGVPGSSYHRVFISPGSRLAAIVGAGGFVRVNSRHHQGVSEAVKAPSLMASAYSLEDRLIEALESPHHDWVIGVQWHNENRDEVPRSFGNLFLALAERGETYSQTRAALSAR
ncbi:MAG: gamma-glutamyl-gamma-aminobutyrate hydrolase family protein [Chloroflexota bacterium]|nr:gamma-glutamyl-gamma-aminobutyrate hydrolase family protein [Chloroflexota bacterium]MDE2942133.1 gamma-glutamyl-gamma-aminobutyrate hydrolase family protein [Chloroflexota bacterium]MDE3268035.1 gamma-glutamyl-gamma-aminobutyrate hydrolase family protein [Chloroflexota bacterium]